jgi:hypothetical protein
MEMPDHLDQFASWRNTKSQLLLQLNGPLGDRVWYLSTLFNPITRRTLRLSAIQHVNYHPGRHIDPWHPTFVPPPLEDRLRQEHHIDQSRALLGARTILAWRLLRPQTQAEAQPLTTGVAFRLRRQM